MKTTGIRKSVAAAGMVVMGMGFTGCVEFTAPLCSTENLEDVAGLEGSKSINTFGADYKLQKQTVEIDRVSKGTYFGGAVQTCRVGSNIVMQSKTENGTYSVAAINQGPTALGFSKLILGAEELQQAGIPFQIVEREQNSQEKRLASLLPMANFAGTKTRVMVIDNSAPESRSAIEKYAVPFGFGLVLK